MIHKTMVSKTITAKNLLNKLREKFLFSILICNLSLTLTAQAQSGVRPQVNFGDTERINALYLHGTKMVSVSYEGIREWDAASLRITGKSAEPKAVRETAIHRESGTFYANSNNGEFYAIDLNTFATKWKVKVPADDKNDQMRNPNKNYYYYPVPLSDGTVLLIGRVWLHHFTGSGQLIFSKMIRKEGVSYADAVEYYFPDGKILNYSPKDKKAGLINLSKKSASEISLGKAQKMLEEPNTPLKAPEYGPMIGHSHLPQGWVIEEKSGNWVLSYPSASGTRTRILASAADTNHSDAYFCYDPQGQRVALALVASPNARINSSDGGNSLFLFNAQTGGLLQQRLYSDFGGRMLHSDVSSNSEYLAFSRNLRSITTLRLADMRVTADWNIGIGNHVVHQFLFAKGTPHLIASTATVAGTGGKLFALNALNGKSKLLTESTRGWNGYVLGTQSKLSFYIEPGQTGTNSELINGTVLMENFDKLQLFNFSNPPAAALPYIKEMETEGRSGLRVQPMVTVSILKEPYKWEHLKIGRTGYTGYFYPVEYLQRGLIKCENPKVVCALPGMAAPIELRFPNQRKLYVAARFNVPDVVVYDEQGYYMAGKKAVDIMHFVSADNKVYSFDQFDLQFNRPDIIIQRTGLATEEQILTYRKAWEKRVRKMGFDPARFSGEGSFDAPELQLAAETDRFAELNQAQYTVNLKASDAKYKLERLFIEINGVPIFGVKGKTIQAEAGQQLALKESFTLTPGKNIVKISVMNEQGVESLAERLELNYVPSTVLKPSLHVISVGVSKFQESDFNLSYADKDANDLVNMLQSTANRYQNIKTHLLTNENATRENVLALRSELEKTDVNDQVIVFIASHGVMDSELDYYIAMHNMSFANPQNGGFRYDELENLLDGIPARNKLMFIDACHSGEVDKDESELVAADLVKSENGVSGRGFKKVTDKTNTGNGIGLANSFELMKELFADLRRTNGAIVISAAAGKEYAFESTEWNNGVFTYSLLEGMKSGNADLNKDQQINVTELSTYVSNRVQELTDGKQNPTSRTENLENDFRVW